MRWGTVRSFGVALGGAVDGDLRLAEVLAALSVATDLGMGHEPEKAVRASVLATGLARSCGLTDPEVRDVYYASLLLHLGCTAPAHELTTMVGDERRFLATAERTDDTTLAGQLRLMGAVGRGAGFGRPRYLARTMAAGEQGGVAVMRATCEVGSRMAERLHLGERVAAALRSGTEVWNGASGAFGEAGDEIPLPARFALLASQAVLFDRLGGPDAALQVVRDRAGGWFDPAIADTFARDGVQLLRHLAEVDVWDEVVAVEPEPARHVPDSRIDEVAGVFADMVDLKTPFTLGHSSQVAELAATAANSLGFPPGQVTAVRRAALLHDLGRVTVSGVVWERDGPLTASQWEEVRLHPYHTERILNRSKALAPLARIAGMHHERLDASGYHHGLGGAAIPVEARLLATADAFQAMTRPRPHRPAFAAEQAAMELESGAAAGGFDVECTRAVVAAAGQRPARRNGGWPAGLTDREVEVLRVLAGGASNRGIAEALVISPRTAEHHVQHIYAKIDASTRAAAALFAIEHGLLR